MIVEQLYCVRCHKLDPNWGTKKCEHCGKNTQYTSSERNEIIEREYKNIMDDFHKKYPKIPYRMLEIYKRIHQHLVIKKNRLKAFASFNSYLISQGFEAPQKPEPISVKREPPEKEIYFFLRNLLSKEELDNYLTKHNNK